MDLDVLLNGQELCQDSWSISGISFPQNENLTVVGWAGKLKGKSDKYYILKCNTCSQDAELFGEGYFRSLKDNLTKGKLPCGCSKAPKWSKAQYIVLCSRKALELGYTFLGFVGEWRGASTKIKLLCEKHGEWSSGSIDTLVNANVGCPGCKLEVIGRISTKPDEDMISSFFSSGSFHPDTKFWKSERKCSQGYKRYWHMYCPECCEVGESFSGDLQQGSRPCACCKQRQQECYINWLIDDHDTVIGIKFGIARDSTQRVKQQDSKSIYIIRQHSVHTFSDVASCKKAERECRQELECGIVLKRDMPDGYTETTWVYNLEKIIEIYERNGGVCLS